MQIPEIKSQLSILTVLQHYGIKTDRNYKANCPFHQDKTPSLQIYPKTNTFCCFSANCTAGTGDQIQFIELSEKQGKHQAITKAKELMGIPQTYSKPTAEKTMDYKVIFQQLEQNFKRSSKAQEYLKNRNIDPTNLEVGYNVNTIKSLKNCIVFPLRNEQNEIVSFYGRSIVNNTTSKHYYTKNRKGLYPKYPSKDTTKLILTESIIDAITLSQHTNDTVLALYGTNGLTAEHTTAINQLENLKEIILWLDGDEAGEQATEKYLNILS